MSGHLNSNTPPAHTVVRCSYLSEDGQCGREQAIESHDGGIGVRVVSVVPNGDAEWLSSFGWLFVGGHWLCPFCASAVRT